VTRPILAIALCAAVATYSAAQDAPGPVPRSVFFPPAGRVAALDKEGQALIQGTPEMLATSIASLQPFTRADSADAARSIVIVAAAPASTDAVSVTVRLLEAGAAITESARVFRGGSLDLAAFRAFISETAARFAPLLGPVDPEADILKAGAQQQLINAAKETDYIDQLDKRLELTLWMSGLLRLLDSTGGDSDAGKLYFGLDLLPIIAEVDWFFSRNLGIQLSFYFHDSNAFDFGQDSRYNAYGLFLFPGVGFIYRTLGEISAEFSITLSAGWIHLTATAGDVVDGQSNVVLSQGSSTWSNLTPRVRISPALVWSMTPAVALKGALGFDFVFPGAFPWYDAPLAAFQFLTVGVAYRL
jgi:hypothetical protein